MPVLARFAFVSAVALFPWPIAGAQDPAPLKQPETIPYDLAATLIAAGGLGAEPQIMVGGIPEWVTSRIAIPSTARILGSAYIGTSVVAILSLPPQSDSALVDLKRDLMRKGWLNPPPATYSTGGFRPAAMLPPISSTRFTLCNDPQTLSASMSRQRGSAVIVTLRVGNAAQYSTCKPPQPPQGLIALQNARPQMPTLYNPSGVTENTAMTGDCMDPRFGNGNTFTSFRTTMTPDLVLDHYARQLQDSGWKMMTVQPSSVSRSWTRPDSTGAPLETTLTVASPAGQPTCRLITLLTAPARKP